MTHNPAPLPASLDEQIIHMYAARFLLTTMLPELARCSGDPRAWMARFRRLVLGAVDHCSMQGSGPIGADLMKAAVISSLEATLEAAEDLIDLQLGAAARELPSRGPTN